MWWEWEECESGVGNGRSVRVREWEECESGVGNGRV